MKLDVLMAEKVGKIKSNSSVEGEKKNIYIKIYIYIYIRKLFL